MNNLSAKVQEAIAAELPSSVAGELKDYITTAQANAINLERALKEVSDLRTQLSELTRLREQVSSLDQRERAVRSKEVELDLKEKLIQLRETHATERVQEIKYLTERVFSSNRIGYNVNLNKSTYIPGTAHNNYCSSTETETVTGELSSQE